MVTGANTGDHLETRLPKPGFGGDRQLMNPGVAAYSGILASWISSSSSLPLNTRILPCSW